MALLLLAGACSDTPDREEAVPAPSTTTARCQGPGPVRDVSDFSAVSAVAGDKLVLIDTNGDRRCISTVRDPATVEWGPQADRVRVDDVVHTADARHKIDLRPSDVVQWSRPSGTSIVAVRDGRLLKFAATGGAAADISFLRRHESVTYHPAGLHVASTGEDETGTRGVWLATNQGKDARLVAVGEDAEISGLQFEAAAGTRLFFVGDHGDVRHVHVADVDAGSLNVVATSVIPISYLTVAPTVDRLAFATGTCKAGNLSTAVHNKSERGDPLARVRGARPVGWLHDGTLVLERSKGCTDTVDVLVLRMTSEHPSVLATGVEDVAVRTPLLGPGRPPGSAPEAEAPA